MFPFLAVATAVDLAVSYGTAPGSPLNHLATLATWPLAVGLLLDMLARHTRKH
jgi:hypothetical protein